MTGPRFRVEPRDVPPAAVARVLGLSEARFAVVIPDLLARGFPAADPTTGNYDLRAVETWQDRRSGLKGLAGAIGARDATAVVGDRLRALRNG